MTISKCNWQLIVSGGLKSMCSPCALCICGNTWIVIAQLLASRFDKIYIVVNAHICQLYERLIVLRERVFKRQMAHRKTTPHSHTSNRINRFQLATNIHRQNAFCHENGMCVCVRTKSSQTMINRSTYWIICEYIGSRRRKCVDRNGVWNEKRF